MSSRTFRELKSPVELEAEVLSFWKEKRIFEKSIAQSEGRPDFVFYEGPPTANGTPHNGHVLTRAIKDLIPRYQTMKGRRVRRKAGWDTHGLPVEVEVEKNLGIKGKEGILAYGLEPFVRKCIDSVFVYTKEWEELTERIGFWVNLDEAYVTYHREYVESAWWALSRLFSKGLLYQGHKVVWWWAQGGTTLSAAEVGGGYKTVDDPSATVKFKVIGQEDTFLLAWTTTPWTLPSNTAIAVNPDLDYAILRLDGQRLIVADALKEQVPGAEVESVIKGHELVGLRYEPLYRYADPVAIDSGNAGDASDAWRVIPGDHVTLEAGTGLVHTAPAFGEDDFKVAREHGIGMLQLVGSDGKFVAGTPWAGVFCKEADKLILQDLKDRGLLFKKETYRHDYPFCPRAPEDPLIQYARPAWFIRTTALNKEVLANNAAIRWMPEHIRDGRFGDFLRNNVDWALSRERFWGTPLNIWVCEACDHRVAPDSVADIERRGGTFEPGVDKHLQVHKPWIDKVRFPCEKCGNTMNRVPEVIDCWFDSGCMPFAQWGFPHQGVEDFRSQFPADFISEAIDQTRGWFYSLLMVSTLVFDEEVCEQYGLNSALPHPYRSCVVLGHVCDMEGKKESKSVGNYTSPDLVMKGTMRMAVLPDPSLARGTVGMKDAQVRSLDLASNERLGAEGPGGKVALQVVKAAVKPKDTVHLHPDDIAALGLEPGKQALLRAPFEAPGADAFRWLFYAGSPPWGNTRLSLRNIREGQRELHIRLKNVHSFFAIYASIAGFDPDAARKPSTHLLDRWIKHELAALNRTVSAAMDGYGIYEAARAIQDFVEGLSNWYVRRSRRRFWEDDGAALGTLYEVLVDLAKMLAPFCPFMADALWLDLRPSGSPESVHLCDWPALNEAALDPALAEEMALVRELSSLGREAREKVGVRVRQPLRAIEVILARPELAARIGAHAALLADELNVREVRLSENADKFVDFKVKPNYPALGKKLGKDMKACAAALAGMPGAEVRQRVLSGGLALELPGGTFTLGAEEIVVEVLPKAGFQASGSASAVVALHADLDDDLRQEGLSREVLSRLQALRKELDLGYTERVTLQVEGDPAVVAAVERFRDFIADEVLVAAWAPVAELRELEVDGLALRVGMARA